MLRQLISKWGVMFRSTGSYEPDPDHERCFGSSESFDPQALTSLTGIPNGDFQLHHGFDPQALTSLTHTGTTHASNTIQFRSTGSYEPDPFLGLMASEGGQFRSTGSYEPDPVAI